MFNQTDPGPFNPELTPYQSNGLQRVTEPHCALAFFSTKCAKDKPQLHTVLQDLAEITKSNSLESQIYSKYLTGGADSQPKKPCLK